MEVHINSLSPMMSVSMSSMTSIDDPMDGSIDGASLNGVPMSAPMLLSLSNLSDRKRTRTSEMKVLADGNVVKLQKTRQRRILSCVHCHSKKIKCLRVQPVCDNCDKLGIECKYFINERVSRGGRKLKVSGPSGTSSSGSAAMAVLESSNSAPGGSIHQSQPPAVKREPLEGPLSHNRSSTSEFSDMNGSPMSPTLSGVTVVEDERRSFLPKKSDPLQESMNFLQMGMTNANSPVSMLQAPIVNSISNNITNNFFNTNYTSNAQTNDELYQFNLNSFNFNTGPETIMNNNSTRISSSVTPSGKEKKPESTPAMAPSMTISNGLDEPETPSIQGILKGAITNFVDGPINLPNSVVTNNGVTTRNSHPNNPGLHNSLNAYLSNPAMTVNYLYGTNTDYENDNLLMDLIKHLPTSRERSFELIDRYVNSVHLLLPIMVNLNGFIVEHEKFWDHFDPYKNHSPSTSSSGSSNGPGDFNLLQFYTLFFPVLYASTISEFEEYDNLLLNQDINKYLKGFNKVCQYYNYPHGLKSIPILLGNVIIQSMSPNPSTMEMSQIIRYAKFLQLHKDPVISLRISDWKVIKFRRMLWWIIFGLDGLSSHNFCLPPVCKFDDFNVLMPEYEDPVFDELGSMTGKKLNVTVLAMTIKFKYDRILSELVYQLHNGLATNITSEEINEIKGMIVNLFHFIHQSIIKMNNFYKASPPTTVQEMNLVNFIKNHSWSFADRAMMLLHKKILLHDSSKDGDERDRTVELTSKKTRGEALSLSEYEDTFGRMQEKNIIRNFNNSSISQLRFNQYELFTYENMQNNLIPSILHNLNDFLKYNDFIKFGKFNWYIKRTIPLDSIILLFVIICVKFKYEFMTLNELVIYVKLINKALFILNRKYFKNEKYKRMLSLTNLTWEYILKKYNVIKLLNLTNDKKNGRIEFFDYQVSGFMNMSELFNVMDVPQPALISNGVNVGRIQSDDVLMRDLPQKWDADDSDEDSPSNKQLNQSMFSNQLIQQNLDKRNDSELHGQKLELMQLNEKIYYDLRNNFVDINDYCTFYSSLENVLHELMDYVNTGNEILL